MQLWIALSIAIALYQVCDMSHGLNFWACAELNCDSNNTETGSCEPHMLAVLTLLAQDTQAQFTSLFTLLDFDETYVQKLSGLTQAST